jgi:hypothetical protein
MTLVNLSGRAPESLPDGAYDVRGWEVRTELDGEEVGKVDEMLVDESDQPRYLVVSLGRRRRVLVPLSEAHADSASRSIWVHRMDAAMLGELPEYGGDPEHLSPAYEERLRHEYRTLALGGLSAPSTDGDAPPLARLSDIKEFRVAKGVTDPRGWKVAVADGQVIGEVRELIVDPRELTTRYLDCEVREDKLGLEPLNRHVLIPPGRVRLNRKEKRVVVEGLLARDLRDYPVYQGLPLGADARHAIDAVYGGTREAGGRDPGAGRFFGVRTRALGDGAPPQALSRGRPEPADVEPVEVGSEAEGDVPLAQVDEETYEIAGDAENVRIRINGDDIIIERKPRGGLDDG